MRPPDPRFLRERDTIAAMIRIHCHDLHDRGRRDLCASCAGILAYADERLDRCVFPGNKPTCVNCPVHCYRPEMRARVKEVMRYSGPRMLYRHPWLALRHWLDGRNQGPFERTKPERGNLTGASDDR